MSDADEGCVDSDQGEGAYGSAYDRVGFRRTDWKNVGFGIV